MKTLLIIISCVFFSITNVNSQNVKTEEIRNLKSENIFIETDYLDIKVQTWKKDYLEVKSSVKINFGSDNDKHDLQFDNSRDGIRITSSIATDEIEQLVITTDKEGNKTFTPVDEWDENRKGDTFHSLNFGYEIDGSVTLFVPEDMLLTIESTYGDVNITGDYREIDTHSTYGLIEVKLEDVSKMDQISLKSTYDIIDLTLNKDSHASLNLQTTYGSVFTDLPLQTNQSNNSKSTSCCSQSSKKYILNEGDTTIDLVATYDNIYVRSK